MIRRILFRILQVCIPTSPCLKSNLEAPSTTNDASGLRSYKGWATYESFLSKTPYPFDRFRRRIAWLTCGLIHSTSLSCSGVISSSFPWESRFAGESFILKVPPLTEERFLELCIVLVFKFHGVRRASFTSILIESVNHLHTGGCHAGESVAEGSEVR